MQQISIHMHATEESMLSFNPSPGTFHKAQDSKRVLLAGPYGDWYELRAVKLAAEINARKAEGSETEQKNQLETYAQKAFGVDLDKRKSLEDLKAEVAELEKSAEPKQGGSNTASASASGPQPKAKK